MLCHSRIKGYAGSFSEDVITRVRQMPEVDYVELDQVVHTLDFDIADANSTQNGAPWVCFSRVLSPVCTN